MRINYYMHSKEATDGLFAIEAALAKSAVPKEIKNLIKIRVSQMNGCLFCLDMHIKEARKSKEAELRVHHVAVWHESKLFTEKEKAALEWAELLTHLPVYGITDEHFAKVKTQFDDKEISDLSFAIAMINLWNRFGVAFTPTPGSMDKLMGIDGVRLND